MIQKDPTWCGTCGHQVRSYDRTCGLCGHQLHKNGKRSIRFICKECGKQTDACHSDHDTCGFCGSRYGNCRAGWER